MEANVLTEANVLMEASVSTAMIPSCRCHQLLASALLVREKLYMGLQS